MRPRDLALVLALALALAGLVTACGDDPAIAPADVSAIDSTASADDVSNDVAGGIDTSAGDANEVDATQPSADAAAPDAAAPADTSPLGGDRPAPVWLPADYAPDRAWPLAILLHGYSASGVVQDFYLGFHERAAAAGLIAVVPDGTADPTGAQFWNASPAWCCNFANSPVDDAAYLRGLITEASARYAVDPDRVYFVGHSNGGFMAFKMACEHADVVAGVVNIAGSTVVDAGDCQPSRPVTVLSIHGTADGTIAYGGAPAQYPSAPQVAARWVGHNGCDAEPVPSGGYDYDSVALGAETGREVWDGCDDGVLTSLWTMSGSGHIPGFTPDFMPDVFDFLLSHRRDAL